MVDFDIDIRKGFAWLLFLAFFLLFIGLQLSGLGLEPQVSDNYVTFYQNLTTLSLLGLIVVGFYVLHFEIGIGEILGIGTGTKLVLFFGFFALIMLTTIFAGQIIPVPSSTVVPFQITAETDLFVTSTLIPAFSEDVIFLMVLPIILITFLLKLVEIIGIEPTRTIAILVIVFATLIASTGYNIWLIPGFTSAHVPAFGEQQNAYLGAWVFSWGQSMVYMFTGYLAPITHYGHNFVVAYGTQQGLNIGQFQIFGPG